MIGERNGRCRVKRWKYCSHEVLYDYVKLQEGGAWMKNLIAMATALGLMAIPLVADAKSGQAGSVAAQPEQAAVKAPSVSQQLVPEGDFALKLAATLKLGTPTTEAQAEDMLAAVGVAPKNGWIADYPMTPIVIGQVRNAVVAAAASKKLPV